MDPFMQAAASWECPHQSNLEKTVELERKAASRECPHLSKRCSNCKNSLAILGELNRTVVPEVNSNARIVDNFIDRLEDALKANKDDVVIIDRVHGGSAFEHLAVEEKADFDIMLILGKPFVGTNFTAGRDPSNYFTLKKKTYERKFADHNGFLIAAELKEHVTDILERALSRIELPGVTLTWKNFASSTNVTMNFCTGNEISVDLVPQIAFRKWGECPDLRPLNEMPESLKKYIVTLNNNGSPSMFFALGIPKPENYDNPEKLFNISFSMLEKKFLSENPDIRSVVCLVKIVAKQRDWEEKFSFKSFHIKRVALKYCDELVGKVLWEGCHELLRCISNEIGRGTIDGYFVRNQVMKRWTHEQIQKFRTEIEDVLRMDAENFL